MSVKHVSAAEVESALRATFGAEALIRVQDDSHLHAGHAGALAGAHFSVLITSARCSGLSRLARHRLVYDSLQSQMKQGIHALVITALSPDEAASQAG